MLKGIQVKLIVIDSIAFHFRTELELSVRTRVLQMVAQKLEDIAESFEIAVSKMLLYDYFLSWL